MMALTRLNRVSFLINPHIIESVEATPDTLLTFINGKTTMVLESVLEVQKKFLEYQKKIHEGSPLGEEDPSKVAPV